jgi:hypothetical protein
VSAFFHGLSQSRNGETTKTSLARTFGVANDKNYPLQKFSLEVWRDTPECLNTSSLLAARHPASRRDDGLAQSTARREEEDEVRNESEGNKEFPPVLLASLVAPVVASLRFSSAVAEKRTTGKQWKLGVQGGGK